MTIFEYSSAYVTLLPSCFVSSEKYVASQSKWQSADLDLLKQRRRGKVCSQRYSEVTCAILRSEMYSKVQSEPKHEVATIEREF